MLKSAVKPILFTFPNKYRSDLLKKVVFGSLDQRASKLKTLKVCSAQIMMQFEVIFHILKPLGFQTQGLGERDLCI